MAKARLMIVEDESIVAADLTDRLTQLGYEIVATAPSGKEALEKAREFQPDLSFMDINLQGDLDGTQVAKILRDELNIPVIFLTAFSDEATLEKAKITEAFGYLLKPFEERELRTNVEIALYKHRMERERERLTQELTEALAKVKTLTGLLPMCGWCKSIRNDQGYWQQVESYLCEHSEAKLSHGLCPECAKKHFGLNEEQMRQIKAG